MDNHRKGETHKHTAGVLPHGPIDKLTDAGKLDDSRHFVLNFRF